MTRVLVLGGYGEFGGRISRRLAEAGYEVIVAGRVLAKAEAFCADDPRLTPARVDRADIAAGLARYRPAVVVDASGPFQAMDLGVPRAAIAAGVHYCDIADSTDFVCAITGLDEAARIAELIVLSGASSVPALSGAVVRDLAADFDDITKVEMAISASNRATAGGSVAAAIVGQVGLPFRLWRGRRIDTVHGWQEMRRQDFCVPDHSPISRRTVALTDVPDVALLPDRLPGKPAVEFRAGGELTFQNRALWILSWLVRWGWLRNLAALGSWLLPLQRLTRRFGSDRSAMIVRMFGGVAGKRMERRWTLIADHGDGPEIPTLAVVPVVAHILSGRMAPGARDAGEALTLDDFAPAFARLHISTACKDIALPDCLYRRVMGPQFDRLPVAVRAMHEINADGGAAGEAIVEGAANPLGTLVARIVGFPSAGHHPVHVSFAERVGVERWTRRFGTKTFHSTLTERGGLLQERFGPARFVFNLTGDETCLAMIMKSWSMFGVPLPLAWAPRSRAREFMEDSTFHFDVPITLPLIGRIVRYTGWLKPIGCGEKAARIETEAISGNRSNGAVGISA